MFNFSANHLLLLSRTEYRSCVVFLMRDDSTRRVYRLYDFTRAIQITPAPELPTTEPETRGLFVERKDNSIFVSAISMDAGGKGVVVQSGGGGDGEVSVSGPKPDGPKTEVVVTNETVIYLETTQAPDPGSGENQVIQQTVKEASLDVNLDALPLARYVSGATLLLHGGGEKPAFLAAAKPSG
jgi:hypothetical protein